MPEDMPVHDDDADRAVPNAQVQRSGFAAIKSPRP